VRVRALVWLLLDARGAAFPGVNMYVQLGRGQDYSWSATSAGQDIIDVFALPLCEPGGGEATRDSMHYALRGRCEPIEVLTRTNAWSPTLADRTPAGSETLTAMRDARDFQRAAHKVGYTFNWFYVDDNDIAYFNSGWTTPGARRASTASSPRRPGMPGRATTPRPAWPPSRPSTSTPGRSTASAS
jgi:acyl-homoserine lactone acylase PvdQ